MHDPSDGIRHDGICQAHGQVRRQAEINDIALGHGISDLCVYGADDEYPSSNSSSVAVSLA